MIKNLSILFLIFFVYSCKTNSQQFDNELEILILKDSIEKPYIFFSEISIISKDKSISTKLNQEIQKLSLNKLSSDKPEERLKEKKYLLQQCINDSENLGCEKSICKYP